MYCEDKHMTERRLPTYVHNQRAQPLVPLASRYPEHFTMSDQTASPPQHPSSQQPQQTPPPQELWFRVFKPELDSVAYDPLDPTKRYHTGIFVLTNPSLGTGTMFQVTGDVISQSGMKYEEKLNYRPGSEAPLHASTQIGVVSKADFDRGVVGRILSALPTPSKQQGLNFWEKDSRTGRYEIIWTKEDGELYGDGEMRRPVFKCNEWTGGFAIPALRDAGVLRDAM
jgi:hypothetical protein